MTPDIDLDALTADVKRAHDELCNIAEGKRRWTMSIPAKEETDSDLVISRGLSAGEKALSALTATRAELETALKLLYGTALYQHHAQCGEASQWDIRRCEDAHCLERAHLLGQHGLLPKEWGAYLAAAPQPDEPTTRPFVGCELPFGNDVWCGRQIGHDGDCQPTLVGPLLSAAAGTGNGEPFTTPCVTAELGIAHPAHVLSAKANVNCAGAGAGDGEQDTATTEPQRQCDRLLPHGWCRLVMHHRSPCNHKLYPSPIGDCWKCANALLYPLDEKVQKHVAAHQQVDAARACVPGAPDDRACSCHPATTASGQGTAGEEGTA
jgi:hypothetical protein